MQMTAGHFAILLKWFCSGLLAVQCIVVVPLLQTCSDVICFVWDMNFLFGD